MTDPRVEAYLRRLDQAEREATAAWSTKSPDQSTQTQTQTPPTTSTTNSPFTNIPIPSSASTELAARASLEHSLRVTIERVNELELKLESTHAYRPGRSRGAQRTQPSNIQPVWSDQSPPPPPPPGVSYVRCCGIRVENDKAFQWFMIFLFVVRAPWRIHE